MFPFAKIVKLQQKKNKFTIEQISPKNDERSFVASKNFWQNKSIADDEQNSEIQKKKVENNKEGNSNENVRW